MNHSTIRLQSRGASDVGRRREANEDSMLLSPEEGIFAVADGMGGHAAGEVASRIVVDTLEDVLIASPRAASPQPTGTDGNPSASERLVSAIQIANARIIKTMEGRAELRGMGTTVVAAMIRDARLTVGYVGDSRCYLLRDGQLQQLTTDHSWVQEQVDLGLLSPKEAHHHPFRNVVTRALGSREEVEVDTIEIDLHESDCVILCSDGLNSMLDEGQISKILSSSGGDPDRVCPELIDAANAAGGEDNVTVIALRAETVK